MTGLLVGVLLAAAPAPVTAVAKAIDGASRTADGKTCTFTVKSVACELAVETRCVKPSMSYSYVMTIPLGAVLLGRSKAVTDAGDFKGSHGFEFKTQAPFETKTDDGTVSTGTEGVFAFGSTEADRARAQAIAKALPDAKRACAR